MIPKCTFKEFLQKDYMKYHQSIINHSASQSILVECDGKFFLDFIGRYEKLNEDWKIVSKKIGSKGNLPILNPTIHGRYTQYYDTWCIKRVANIYKRDIELFGYKFGK